MVLGGRVRGRGQFLVSPIGLQALPQLRHIAAARQTRSER
jgi:hypothetical protein